MKYMLMMTGTKADFDWYAKWSKEDIQAEESSIDCAWYCLRIFVRSFPVVKLTRHLQGVRMSTDSPAKGGVYDV